MKSLGRWSRNGVTATVRLCSLMLLVAVLGAACSSEGDGDASAGGNETTTSASGQVADTSGLVAAIERTAAYFDDHPPRGDVGFLLGQGSSRLSPDFQQWAEVMEPDPQVTQAMADPAALQYLEALLWMGRNRPPVPWEQLPLPSVEPSTEPSTLSDEELSGVTEVVGMAVRCEELDAAKRQQWLDLLATPSHSYLLTHQLLSLVWGRTAGCLSDAEADPLRTALATAVYAELLGDGNTVNDLTLERMAMLCYADLCDWVDDAQTHAVVAGQYPDGTWGDGSVPIHADAFVPPDHTAGLGFYVLAMKWDPATPPPTPPPSG